MNDKIRELWTKCILDNTKTPMNFQDAADQFARLIVEECINACFEANDIRNIVPPTQEQVVLWCAENIANRFGVE